MDLLYQEKIDQIKDCPNNQKMGEIKLYRWIDKNNLENAYLPQGFKEKFKDNCEAWGLSVYNSEKEAKQVLKNLSVGFQKKFNAISFCNIKDEFGIKHQSGTNQNHYTFYPAKEFYIINNFQIIENEK